MRLRELIGRGYLLDLAVLGTASDGVVCAVSSAGCRLAGVMMGWEAVERARWVNVDEGRGWSWDGRGGDDDDDRKKGLVEVKINKDKNRRNVCR